MPQKTTSKPSQTKKIPRAAPRWLLWSSAGLILVVALVVFFAVRLNTKTTGSSTAVPTLPVAISADQAYVLFNNKASTFVDVRPANDWKAFHIQDSLSIPAEELSGRLAEIPHTMPVVVVDASGGDAAIEAVAILMQNGFSSVTMVTGGVNMWVQSRYPIIGTAPY